MGGHGWVCDWSVGGYDCVWVGVTGCGWVGKMVTPILSSLTIHAYNFTDKF